MRASYTILQGFPGGSEVKVSATMRETWVQSLGREDLLEKEMATHSSILAWRIPWMEEPGGLQSMGSQRVGHDWATSLTHSANEEASPTNTNCLESEKIKTKTQPSKAQNDWEGTQGNLLGEKWMFYVVTGLRTPGLHRYSESEVTLSCRTLCNPMDCSLTRLFCTWDFPGESTGLGCHCLLQQIFPTQGWNPGLPHCRQMLYRLSHQGSPYIGITTGQNCMTRIYVFQCL